MKTRYPFLTVPLALVTLYQSVSVQLSDLKPGTTYHWRVVAKNSTETTFGRDRTFTTYAFSPFNDACPNAHVRQQTGAASLLDCRAYELVSAANTGGYDVESNLVEGQTPYAGYPEAEDPPTQGQRPVLYAVHDGGIPGTDNPTNRGPDPYVATRGENGWSTEYVGVPADNPFSAAPFTSIPSGADASLETFAFGSPGGCSPCFAGGYTGIPVRLPSGKLVQGMVGLRKSRPLCQTRRLHRQGPLRQRRTLHLRLQVQIRARRQTKATISIYDRNLTTEETHVVSKTPGGATMKEEGQEIAELDISSDGSHILIGQAHRRSRRRQATGTST